MNYKSFLSVIIPCYNEEGHLKNSYKRLRRELEIIGLPFELIFIDDKSKDKTKNIILEICKKDKKAKYILHKRNVGRGGTVSEGINKSKGDYVGFIDIDLEVSEKYISSFIKELEKGYDIVIAKRKYDFKFNSIVRGVLSKTYIFFERKMLDVPFRDTEAGYKFFHKGKILPILKQIRDKKWFWDTEIVVRSYYKNLKISEVEVVFRRRTDKKSTVKIFEDSLYYLKNIYNFKKELNIPFFFQLSLIKSYGVNIRGLMYVLFKTMFFRLLCLERNLPKEGLIIDFGCGEGIISNTVGMFSPYRNILGIDLSSQRLKIANNSIKRRSNIKFLKADILCYKPHRSKAVIMSDFLHHIAYDEQIKLIKKCFSSINNGKIVIKEINNGDKVKHYISCFFDLILYREMVNVRTEKAWIKILKEVGFKNIKTYGTPFFLPFSTLILVGDKNE